MACLQAFVVVVLLLYPHAKPSAATDDFFYHATVALDGSGGFKSINSAVLSAPANSRTRFYIHIKAGTYYEYVQVPQDKTMIAFIGDGASKTIITGNRSPRTGYGTNNSSTVAISGNGFMAQHITFENSAGHDSGQAVALMSTADQSVYYKCNFLAYQDTLYAGCGTQFYKECDIHGTVDFIFGNAAAVFQDCSLYARANKMVTFTAHGRNDFHQKTGFSFENCYFTTSDGVEEHGMKAYFGRPWGPYATTLIVQSNIAVSIDPKGWLKWDCPVDNVIYWEYENTGRGSSTTSRVDWNGHKVVKNSSDLIGYTVANLIHGDMWLPETKVPYRTWLK